MMTKTDKKVLKAVLLLLETLLFGQDTKLEHIIDLVRDVLKENE